MKIKINGQFYETGVVRNGNNLSLGIVGVEDIAAVYASFAPNLMPEIVLYDDKHVTSAIYANHRVTGVAWNPDNVQVNLVVDPLEVSEATRINDAIAEQNENANISDNAIADLAELVASLEERISALEANEGSAE